MNLSLPSAEQLIERFGAREVAQVAVPQTAVPIAPALLLAAARGEPLDDWNAEDVDAAVAALARIADAMTRARNELGFYLRYRDPDEAVPAWVTDDLLEMARYHLFDESGGKDSTIRLRYQDVIARLSQLASDDEARGAAEGGGSGLEATGEARLFSRRTLSRL